MKKYLSCLLIIVSIHVFGQRINLNQGETPSEKYFEEFDFEFVKNKIIVSVELADSKYKFLLDTGAPNIISKELDSLLKPKIIGKIPVSDANNVRDTMKVVSVEKLKFGNVVFDNTATLVSDLSILPVWECFGIDGFIGSNMLRNSIIQIDLKNKKIRLTDDIKNLNLNKKNSTKIKLSKSQSSPYMLIELTGMASGKERVLIDTGDDGLYDIAIDRYRRLENEKIFKKIGESTGASSIGIFGDVPASKHYRLQLPSIKINSLEIENYISTTTNSDNSRIGSEMLNHGIVTIDYLNKRFYIQPEFEKISWNNEDFGFSRTLKNESLIVGFVWDPELKNKLNYGDEILEINGENVEICDLILNQPFSKNHDSVRLKIKPTEGEIFEIEVDKKQEPSATQLQPK